MLWMFYLNWISFVIYIFDNWTIIKVVKGVRLVEFKTLFEPDFYTFDISQPFNYFHECDWGIVKIVKSYKTVGV